MQRRVYHFSSFLLPPTHFIFNLGVVYFFYDRNICLLPVPALCASHPLFNNSCPDPSEPVTSQHRLLLLLLPLLEPRQGPDTKGQVPATNHLDCKPLSPRLVVCACWGEPIMGGKDEEGMLVHRAQWWRQLVVRGQMARIKTSWFHWKASLMALIGCSSLLNLIFIIYSNI